MEGVEKDLEQETQVSEMESEGGMPAGTDQERLAQTQAELAGLKDQLMRQAAEFQNYRRRTEQEKQQMMDYGKLVVVQQLLDVLDDFERSLEAAKAVGEDPEPEALPEAFRLLHQGVAMVYGKLLGELAKLGVEQIDAQGKPFNEDEHEALMSQPAGEGEEPGHVVGQVQTGYKMGDRVIRHARVVVTA